jgi:hypothetical protein
MINRRDIPIFRDDFSLSVRDAQMFRDSLLPSIHSLELRTARGSALQEAQGDGFPESHTTSSLNSRESIGSRALVSLKLAQL